MSALVVLKMNLDTTTFLSLRQKATNPTKEEARLLPSCVELFDITKPKETTMAKTKNRKLKKVHVPAHTKKVGKKTVKVREHYRSTQD
jgi:hypothetical protein